MDPNANLERQLEIVRAMEEIDRTCGGNMSDDEQAAYVDLGGQLSELVTSLHEWILSGGFLPDAWADGLASP